MKELFLIATIAGRTVAIDSDQVESVVDLDMVTPVPLTGDSVRGIAALRSRVVTVIDSRVALGLPAEDSSDGARAIITPIDGHHYAIMVDAVDDVMPFDRNKLADGVVLDTQWQHAARGVIEQDGEPILVIDIATLVPGQPIAA